MPPDSRLREGGKNRAGLAQMVGMKWKKMAWQWGAALLVMMTPWLTFSLHDSHDAMCPNAARTAEKAQHKHKTSLCFCFFPSQRRWQAQEGRAWMHQPKLEKFKIKYATVLQIKSNVEYNMTQPEWLMYKMTSLGEKNLAGHNYTGSCETRESPHYRSTWQGWRVAFLSWNHSYVAFVLEIT